MKLFLPDRMFGSVFEITPALLQSCGIRAAICDIDNTLVTYDDPEPTAEVVEWLHAMRDAGITVGFLSNNNEARVTRFNASLGLFARYNAKKPRARGIAAFLREGGFSAEETVEIGDQIFTDVVCGRLAGVHCFLVPPIKDKRTLFFRCKRFLEKPFLHRYRRLQRIKTEKHTHGGTNE